MFIWTSASATLQNGESLGTASQLRLPYMTKGLKRNTHRIQLSHVRLYQGYRNLE